MKLPPLSNRLQACSSFIRKGDRVADIGCDHGYLGIQLLVSGIASSVIAADVNPGPLNSAVKNAALYGVSNHMHFYLSDGVKNVPKDFDALVCAGMGADTMISILDAAPWLKSDQYRLILQCQSKRPELRKYLYAQGYSILRETLAEDGKFIYPVMEVIYAPTVPLSPVGYHISPALLECQSPLLPAFFQRVKDGLRITVDGLSHCGGEKYNEYRILLEELMKLEEQIYGNRS